MRRSAFILAAAGVTVAFAAVEPGLYQITQSIPLGAPDRWDYITYDPAAHRVYAAHSTSIAVIDAQSGTVIGSVPVPGANGTAIVASAGKGYAGSRNKQAVLVFDLATLKVTKEVPADEDTDGAIYDSYSKRVFVMEGEPQRALVIDTATDSVVAKIDLGGDPEFAASDGAGKVFINVADKREIVRIDARTLKVDARWPIPACEGPHGLAIDPVAKRLFSTCANARMMVVDSTSGTIVAQVPIGAGSDGAAFDLRRKLALSANGEGTLSVVHADAAGQYVSLGNTPTQPLARTLAVDPESGRVFLLAGDRIEVDPKAANPRNRYSVGPGSARLLFADPGS